MPIAKCVDFIATFEDASLQEDATHGKLKYKIQMQRVANFQDEALRIELGDLEEHFRGDPGFVDRVKLNTKRYVSLFSEAIDQLMPEKNINLSDVDENKVSNILFKQRRDNMEFRAERMAQNYMTDRDPHNDLPSELKRRYQLFILRGPNEKRTDQKLREIHADTIGGLVCFRGIVTKASEIRPCVEVACYSCEVCGNETYQTVHGREFAPLLECPANS